MKQVKIFGTKLKKIEGEFFALLSAICVTGYFVINRHVYTTYAPSSIDYTSTFMLIAGSLGLFSLLVRRVFRGVRSSSNASTLVMLGMGVNGSIGIGMTVIGQKYTLASNAAILTTLAVITTIIFSKLILGTAIPRTKLPWVALQAIGVYVAIIGFSSYEPRVGDWIIVGSSIFFGLGNTLTGVVVKNNDPGVARDYRFLTSGVIFGLLILLTNASFVWGIGYYPYVAALLFWLCIMFFNKAVKLIGPSHTIVINNTHVIITMLVSIPLLSEHLTLSKALGAALVLLAIQKISSKK